MPCQDTKWFNDGMFKTDFDDVIGQQQVTIVKTPVRSPNRNAFIERFVKSIQQECLEHFVIFGTHYMDVLYREHLSAEHI